MARRTLTHWGAAVSLGLTVMAGQARGLGTAFTYQGQLEQSGAPANDACDFQFSLFDAVSAGTQVGTTQTVTPVSVTDGLFTVPLDFGGSAFDGNDRWLQIAVRCPVGSGSYTTLNPRQPLTAAPYALYAPSAGSAADLSCSGCVSPTDLASGAVTDQKVASGIAYSKLTGAPTSLPPNGPAGGSLSGTYPNPGLAANSVTTTQIQNAAVTLAKLSPSGAASGQSPVWNGSNLVWGNPTTGLTLPFAGSVSGNSPAFSITQNGFGSGVQSVATSTTGAPIGVHGQSDAPAGVGVSGLSAGDGVRGVSNSLTGLHYGVLGRSVSDAFAAAGVRGEATALSGQVIGVEGVAPNSAQGAGVVGRGPKSVGGYFENSANTAAAFAANFSASGSNAYGVYGEARSNDFGSAGVHGRQLSSTGQVVGVEGVAIDSPIGTGVVGRGRATGGYFENAANSPYGTGVVARGGTTGVAGYGDFGDGVYGRTNILSPSLGAGVHGYTAGDSGCGNALWCPRAVWGEAPNVDYAWAGYFDGDVYVAHDIIAERDITATRNLSVFGKIYGQFGDVAEFVTSQDTLQPGDVVEIDPRHPGEFRRAATPFSTAVAGVVSTEPGLVLNSPATNAPTNAPALALAGRVPVKVSVENGVIHAADLLVASATAGHAMKADPNPPVGSVIGKALGSLDAGTGVIEMLVMLR